MAAYLLSYQILLIVQLFIDQHRKSTKALHVVTDNRGSPVYGPILEQTKILSKESPKCLQSCYYPTNSTQCLFRAASRSQESSPCKVRRVGHGVSHEEDKLSTILQIIIFLQSSQHILIITSRLTIYKQTSSIIKSTSSFLLKLPNEIRAIQS